MKELGEAKFQALGNDLFWSYWHYENGKFFKCKWTGYNDNFWWSQVAPTNETIRVKNEDGLDKEFKIDFTTNMVYSSEEV